MTFFVIDSLLKRGYSGEIEPARKFTGEIFENLEMAFDFWLLAALGFGTKTGLTPG